MEWTKNGTQELTCQLQRRFFCLTLQATVPIYRTRLLALLFVRYLFARAQTDARHASVAYHTIIEYRT